MSLMAENKNDLNMVLKRVSNNINLLAGNFFIDGKRSAAEKSLFSVLKSVKRRSRDGISSTLERSFSNVSPLVLIKSKRVGGGVYKIPVDLKESKRTQTAAKWLVKTSSGRKLGPRLTVFEKELLLSLSKSGSSFQKRKSLHQVAVSNRAYIKYL